VIGVCLEDQRWRDATPAHHERDLEEIRLLFARYRRAVSLAKRAEDEAVAAAERDREAEQAPVGAGV
jgi:hypothetical protein